MSIQVVQVDNFNSVSEAEIARLIVETLLLEIAPQDIDPAEPLFGDGLGLDSIDSLEIVLAISRQYGVDLRSEDHAAFASVTALTSHIIRHTTK